MEKMRTYETFSQMFEKDKNLNDLFISFCDYTTSNISPSHFDVFTFNIKSSGYNEFIDYVTTSQIIYKSREVIGSYIGCLVRCGLIRYVVDEPFPTDNSDETLDELRYEHYARQGHPNNDSRLILVEAVLGEGCTGAYYYGRLLKDKAEAESEAQFSKEFEEAIIDSIHEVIDPDIEKVSDLAKRTEKKLNEFERMHEQSIVKNIEVLSVFVAIIALLFGGIQGALHYESIGTNGILVLGATIIIGIFTLLIFTELYIVKAKPNAPLILFSLVVYLVCFGIIIYAMNPNIIQDVVAVFKSQP